ncbi:MAG: IclR family transcriptional regulator [Rhodobacteraceae bacterium]|nr:MAG: IclR family transcriptional regulator [Paracoccaceae bacterium]
MSPKEQNDGTIGKALQILDLVANSQTPVKFTELLLLSKFPKATLHRFLKALVNQGILNYHKKTQTYTTGIRLVALAHNAWKNSLLAPIAKHHVTKLGSEILETIHLAQMNNGHVIYADKYNPIQPIQMFLKVGKIGPGYCTGVGKAILAFMADKLLKSSILSQSFQKYTNNTITTKKDFYSELKKLRSEGIALDNQEYRNKTICMAAPILLEDKRVIASISITSTTVKHGLNDLFQFKNKLKRTAENISKDLQKWDSPFKHGNSEDIWQG